MRSKPTLVALSALVTSLLVWDDASYAANKSTRRAYSGGAPMLELGGAYAGRLNDFEGGSMTADVVSEKLGSDLVVRKHLGPVKPEPIHLSVGTEMSKAFYDALKAVISNAKSPPRLSGAVLFPSANNTIESRMSFSNALVTEIRFPALDGGSKESGEFDVTLVPEITTKAAGGTAPKTTTNPKQKRWLTSNFRLRIDGLEESCRSVSKIEPIVVSTKVVEDPVGEMRNPARNPGATTFSNLVVTLPEASAGAFTKWHDDFVLKGNSGQAKEKRGSLEFLSPDMKEVLFTLNFEGLGIFRLAPEPVEVAPDGQRRVQASFYFEKLDLSYGASLVSP